MISVLANLSLFSTSLRSNKSPPVYILTVMINYTFTIILSPQEWFSSFPRKPDNMPDNRAEARSKERVPTTFFSLHIGVISVISMDWHPADCWKKTKKKFSAGSQLHCGFPGNRSISVWPGIKIKMHHQAAEMQLSVIFVLVLVVLLSSLTSAALAKLQLWWATFVRVNKKNNYAHINVK